MTKKMTNADALVLLAENAAANTKVVKELTALLGEVTTKPENGKNGETPYIKDGNWWIGTEDTGITAAIKMPIETFIFDVTPELSPEDKAKVDAGTHEATESSKVVVSLGKEYANKPYLLVSKQQGTVLGQVDANGDVNCGFLFIVENYKGLLFVFNSYEKPKAQAYLFVNEKATDENGDENGFKETLQAINGLAVKVQDGAVESIKLTGKNDEGEAAERNLYAPYDRLEVLREGVSVFDSQDNSDIYEVAKLMDVEGLSDEEKGSEKFHVNGDAIYTFKVTTVNGVTISQSIL